VYKRQALATFPGVVREGPTAPPGPGKIPLSKDRSAGVACGRIRDGQTTAAGPAPRRCASSASPPPNAQRSCHLRLAELLFKSWVGVILLARPSPLERPDRLPEDDKMSTPPLRVMLVDDHQVVRDGIKALLATQDDIVVCAEAATVRQAVAEADRALPDVIVMDVRLQDGSGIEATRDIRAARPQTSVLMLTSFADDQALFASIMAGAAGEGLKQIRGDDLVQAIRTVGAGQSLLDPAVTKGVLDRLRTGKHLLKDERLARLSPRRNASWSWSRPVGPTSRSARNSTWPRRPSRTMSPAS
jgi:DNA-binding NarL/FixJ family response regulator